MRNLDAHAARPEVGVRCARRRRAAGSALHLAVVGRTTNAHLRTVLGWLTQARTCSSRKVKMRSQAGTAALATYFVPGTGSTPNTLASRVRNEWAAPS